MIQKRHRRVLGLLILLPAVLVLVGLPGRALWQEQQNQALITAIKREDAPEAKRLLQKGADPNARAQSFLRLSLWQRLVRLCSKLGGGSAQNATEPSALACAIAVDNTEIARDLLQHGAKILPLETVAARSKRWQGDPEPMPLLLAAARSGNTELVRLLLDHGARLDTRNDHGETVLTIAVGASPDYREEAVLARGSAPIVFTPIESQPYIALVRFLLERGADPNVTTTQDTDPNALPLDPETAIERAAAHNQPEMVVDLLARGADPNRGVCDGNTALCFATDFSNLPMMRLLLAHGANVNPPACDSPLTTATDPTAVNLLLDHGADVNGRLTESSDAGDTALMGMIKQNQPDLVRLLVARGADVNVLSTRDGHTALILAAIVGDAATVRFLLQHGAHINTVNRFGGTALQEAMQRGNHNLVKLLLAHGAKVSVRNKVKEISAHGGKTLR